MRGLGDFIGFVNKSCHLVRNRPVKICCKCMMSKVFRGSSRMHGRTSRRNGSMKHLGCHSLSNGKIIGSGSRYVVNSPGPSFSLNLGLSFGCGHFALDTFFTNSFKFSVCGAAGHRLSFVAFNKADAGHNVSMLST